jgi:biopolymer transport protein ExbD
MATISTTGKAGGRKAVDAEVPLIPFIDLLLCCVMFLLVAAVWNDLASLNAQQRTPGDETPQMDDPPPDLPLVLSIRDHGYELSSGVGDRTEVPKLESGYDNAALGRLLAQRRELDPNQRDLVIAPDDGVRFEFVAVAMDTATGAGFDGLSLADGS